MPWWGWVLIIVGAVVIGYFKIKIFNKITHKNKEEIHHEDED